MIVKNKSQRVAVLVDVQNLYYSARNLYGARISFKNLLGIALEGRVLTRAIAYVIKSDVTNGEGDFFSAVHDAGFEVKEKELQVFPGGAKKGDWDLGIAMDAIRIGNKVDSIVLVSGDGDYVPVVSYLQQSLGCLVEVVAFDKTCSKALREIADDFISIESHSKELLFKTEKSTRTSVVPQRPPVPGFLRLGRNDRSGVRNQKNEASDVENRKPSTIDEPPIRKGENSVFKRTANIPFKIETPSKNMKESAKVNEGMPIKRPVVGPLREGSSPVVLGRDLAKRFVGRKGMGSRSFPSSKDKANNKKKDESAIPTK